MITSVGLSGKNIYNKLSLTGKKEEKCQNIPDDIKSIKILILNNLIIPLISKKWNILNENLFCIGRAKKKLDYYYNIYQLEDLIIYKEIINAFELIICEHQQLEDLEKKMYTGNKDFSTMMYKTTMIKLKPEYEIYDNILGKPDKLLNQKYNQDVLLDIQKLLLYENINFSKIKDIINAKYSI